MTGSKQDDVRAFFGTDHYLERNPGIHIRALLVRDLLGSPADSRIIDVGCGDGSISLQFLPVASRLTLVDRSPNMLTRARENSPPEYRSRVEYVHSDLLDFIPDHPYDIVLCIGVLAHVDSVEATVARVAELIRPGGRAVLQVTDYDQALSRVLFASYALRDALTHERSYALNKMTAAEVVEIAARHGMQLAASRRYSLAMPGMGKLPYSWLRRFEEFAMRHPFLSRHSSQSMILLVKDEPGETGADGAGHAVSSA